MAGTNVVLGTGNLGGAVVRRLQSEGKPVRVISRSGTTRFDGVESAKGDLKNADFVARVCQGAESVFHCVMPLYQNWISGFLPLNTAIIEGVSRTDASLTWGDNLYAYGRVEGARTEDTPMAAETRKGRLRKRLAEQLLEANESGRLKATIVRAADFYGPGVRLSTAGDFMFKRVLEGKSAQWLGDPDAPHSFSHIDDFASAMVTLSGSDQAWGKVWHAPTLSGISAREFVSEIARQVGAESKVSVPPKIILRIMSLFTAPLKETFEMEYERTEPFLVDSSRFENTFGSKATELQKGVSQTIEWFRDNVFKGGDSNAAA